jgi:pyruvate formate lyase activating enzyme
MVFDIRRFSVHDGRGIRTTVFLKGCPLRCRWCQNPEGIEPFRRPLWLSGACIHCGRCTRTADTPRALDWDGDVLRIDFDPAAPPETWEAALDACPAKALTWSGRPLDVEEVMEEVEKDRVFFTHSGGCTLSGGEPLAQGGFALALLEQCRKAGIHTAIETSLYAPPEIVGEAAELCDQIFADCKVFDGPRHAGAAGRDNALILDNLERLLLGKHAGKVTVRTPLVPLWTAVPENIAAIAAFIAARNTASHPVFYELLNYNPLARSKYPHGDLEWTLPENTGPFDAEQMETFRQIAREKGVHCV